MPLNERGNGMRWLRSNLNTHKLLWLTWIVFLTGCGHQSSNEYFCPPTVAYDLAGMVRHDVYAVDRQCFKSMTEKQRACYTEAR